MSRSIHLYSMLKETTSNVKILWPWDEIDPDDDIDPPEPI